MGTKITLKAESILEEMLKTLRSERSSLYSDAHLSKLASNYNLSFRTHKFKIVTTIKLDLEFRLIGVFTCIPEDSDVKDVALAKISMNEKLLSLYEVKIAPVLSKFVGA